jgi:hypothetical protein
MIEGVDWRALRDAGERVWLFWPDGIHGHCPAVADYLRRGEDRGVPRREKVKVREPWFWTRMTPRPDGLISGMTPFGPWVCLNGMPRLSVTNTLYTVHFRRRLTRSQRAAWVLSLLCSHTAAQHARLGRRYSDGLLKFEPRDVMALVVPTPRRVTADVFVVYRKAVQLLLNRDFCRARTLADDFVLGVNCTDPCWDQHLKVEGVPTRQQEM